MKRFWAFVYNGLVIPGFWLLFHMGALFNRKIRRGITGRRGLFLQLGQRTGALKHKRRIWFHSSSLGEFEQAKPIIAALRKKYDSIDILVTFFSPSGYEHARNYKLADLITYIPFDTARNARRFLDLLRPDVAVMVRYDIWPNHVWELARRKIPTLIANATLRKESLRLRWPFRNFHYHVYESLSSILTVSENDVEAFKMFGLTGPELIAVGETRYDQVWQRSEEARVRHLIPDSVLRNRRVFVLGSSWEEDEDVVLSAFRTIAKADPAMLMILVPHEPTVETLERLEVRLTYLGLRTIRFSDLNDYSLEPVIIVDSVGILMTLYQYADVAFVGGSFRQGVHNMLEPAVYGIPVLYGPKHQNSQEAVELALRGGGFVIHDEQGCAKTLQRLFLDHEFRKRAGSVSLSLVRENIGATNRFLDYLCPHLKLPS
ncbi:MAG: glycosyltransferase N-terminal domain-containing protein [Bacteroidota bacterium]